MSSANIYYISKWCKRVLVWPKLYSAIGFVNVCVPQVKLDSRNVVQITSIVPRKLFVMNLCVCLYVCVRERGCAVLWMCPSTVSLLGYMRHESCWLGHNCFLFTCTVFITNCGLCDVHVRRQSNALSLLMIHKALNYKHWNYLNMTLLTLF